MNNRVMALSMGLLMALAGCGGGGGDAGCSVYASGCDGSEAPAVSQLRMTLSAANVSNGALTDVVATVTALTSTNKAVPGVDVVYSVEDGSASSGDEGAFIESTEGVTSESGKTTATVDLGTDKTNRVITVTASAGGRTVSKTINVQGSVIGATLTSLVDPATPETIVFSVNDSNGAAIVNTPIVVEAIGLGVRSAQTDSNGLFSYNYTVPNSPGNSLAFTVSAAGVTKQYPVNIKAAAQVLPAPVLTSGLTQALQVNPNVVAVNAAGSELNRMQVVASFEDNAGRPIPNMRVSFRLTGTNAVAVGGKFSNGPISGTPVLASDADGKVQSFYIPSTRSSPNNAISVTACYGTTDAEAFNCTNNAAMTAGPMSKPITIADEAVSVSIGTDGALIDEKESLSYAQQFIIKVVNSAGQPKAGLTVSGQINTVNYYKGFYVRGTDAWFKPVGGNFMCAKEDLDDDDRLDSTPVNEDLDHDTRLEPIRADVSLTAPNGWITNAEGIVLVKMSYPKNVATWMTINLQASSLVGGSEGRASRQQLLRALLIDVQAEALPAFAESPYGIETGNVTLGTNRTMPDGTVLPSGTVLTPCLNPD